MAEPALAVAAEGAPAAADIEGRLDAVSGGKVYGWARDRARPDAALTVELRVDGIAVGTATADLERADLKAGGFGAHAFEVAADLPDDTPLERLSVLATVPETGDSRLLHAPAAAERALDAALAPHMLRLGTALEQLRRDQRRLAQAQLQAVAELRGGLAEPQAALAERIEALELALVRIDHTLSGLAAKPPAAVAAQPLAPRHALGAIVAIAFAGLCILITALV